MLEILEAVHSSACIRQSRIPRVFNFEKNGVGVFKFKQAKIKTE